MTLPVALEVKLEQDTALRLNLDGTPRNPGNDYERHLYARLLRQQGFFEEEVRGKLLALIQIAGDVPQNKLHSYIEDILHSVLVGFPDPGKGLRPAYQQIGG